MNIFVLNLTELSWENRPSVCDPDPNFSANSFSIGDNVLCYFPGEEDEENFDSFGALG